MVVSLYFILGKLLILQVNATAFNSEFCRDNIVKLNSTVQKGTLYSPGFPNSYGWNNRISSCIFNITGLNELSWVKIEHYKTGSGAGPCLQDLNIKHQNVSGLPCDAHQKVYKGRSCITLMFEAPNSTMEAYPAFVISYEG